MVPAALVDDPVWKHVLALYCLGALTLIRVCADAGHNSYNFAARIQSSFGI